MASCSENFVSKIAVGHVHRDFWSKTLEWGKLCGSFGGRSGSGARSSGFLVDEVTVGQALNCFFISNSFYRSERSYRL